MQLNLNADMGESFGPWPMGDDQGLLPIVNSANVACGFHAGDPLVMQRTVVRAGELGVSIGAHPGFPDLQGYGRRPMSLPAADLDAAIIYQTGALAGTCRAAGVQLTHVKPHGALNNMACEDRPLADVIARAVARYDSGLILLAPALSQLASAGYAAGLPVALEVFADRTYTHDGTLVSRREPGAVIDHADDCIAHVQRMLEAGGIVSTDGTVLSTPFHSICVHGDNNHAVQTADALRTALLADGHELHGLPDVLQSAK